MFSATNNLLGDSYTVNATAYIDIICVPRMAHQIPASGTIGLANNDSYTMSVRILSNPAPTPLSWSFTDYNGTEQTKLPDNVHTEIDPAVSRLSIEARLTIDRTRDFNYGSYKLHAASSSGSLVPVIISVSPLGPPGSPSAPTAINVSAVSLTISWTAGFNGGYVQRFTVIYRNVGTSQEYTSTVQTDDEVSSGSVVLHKLKDPATIFPDTEYEIWIQAENDFRGGSVLYGTSTYMKTLELAVLSEKTTIKILDDTSAQIDFFISGPWTHIIEENCVSGTSICVSANISFSSHQMYKRATEARHFTEIVPLAATDTDTYIFTLTLYHGIDMLLTTQYNDIKPHNTDTIGIAVGVTVGVILAVVVAATFIVLWRKGIFTKDKRLSGERANAISKPGHDGIDNEAIRHGEAPTRPGSGPQRKAGPVTGELYAVVATKRRPDILTTAPEAVYTGDKKPVKSDHFGNSHTATHVSTGSYPKFNRVGEDGIVYANLTLIGQRAASDEIQGKDQVTDYATVDFKKTENLAKKMLKN